MTANEEAPPQSMHTAVAPKECGAQGEYERDRGLSPGLSHHKQPGADSLGSEADLAVWRGQQRQLVAVGGSAAETMQSDVTGEAGLDEGMERAGAEAAEGPPVHHEAWQAERLRPLNGVLGAELRQEELLLEAVGAPWKEMRGEESNDEEVRMCSPLYPSDLVPKRMRDETSGQEDRSEEQQKGGSRRQGGVAGKRTGGSKWCMPGFGVDPGGETLVAGRYTVKAVQAHVILQGPAGRETWLGVDM